MSIVEKTERTIQRPFVMTVDVDGWSSLLGFYNVNHDPTEADLQVKEEDGLTILLDLFNKHDISATFFIPGDMVRRHPEKIREVARNGHELGCHGLLHKKNEFFESLDDQRKTIRVTTALIRKETGLTPIGFRAPCLRYNEDTFIALQENGYLYDTSAVATFIPGYYGRLNFAYKPYRIKNKLNEDTSLVELPVSVNPLLPLSLSAAWMRNLGLSWVKFGVKTNFMEGNPVVFYIHPRDVLTLPKVAGVPWHLYRNVGKNTVKMLDDMLYYAKSLGASFVKGSDLAKIYSSM